MNSEKVELYNQRMRQREEEQKLMKINSLIPIRFRSVETPDQSLVDSICSIIWGGFGTGKTWAAYSLAKALLLSDTIRDFKVLTETGLMNEIKAGFSDGTFSQRVKNLESTGLLVIDEIGKSNDSEFNKSQLFEILNNRYNWMRRTVLICNAEKKEDLIEIIPTAVLDRFRENIIHLGGKSRRYSA